MMRYSTLDWTFSQNPAREPSASCGRNSMRCRATLCSTAELPSHRDGRLAQTQAPSLGDTRIGTPDDHSGPARETPLVRCRAWSYARTRTSSRDCSELYREHRLSTKELHSVLSLDMPQVHAFLKEHGVPPRDEAAGNPKPTSEKDC
jgi:hypothetical protein